MTPETILHTYQRVARPIMLRYMGGDRRTCVASTRITIETMRYFGLEADPVAVQLVVQCPALKYAYISGFSKEERRKMARRNKKPIQTRGFGYNGHVIAAVAGRWLVDASLDQAESPEHGLTIEPTVLVMPLPKDETISLQKMRAEMTGVTDAGQRLEIRYVSHSDYSFVDSGAWEFCAGMQFVVSRVIEAMTVCGLER